MRNILLLFVLWLSQVTVAWAHNETTEDFLRSTGKIYVVFAVILSIFVGLIVFLIWLDRRVARIEKHINSES